MGSSGNWNLGSDVMKYNRGCYVRDHATLAVMHFFFWNAKPRYSGLLVDTYLATLAFERNVAKGSLTWQATDLTYFCSVTSVCSNSFSVPVSQAWTKFLLKMQLDFTLLPFKAVNHACEVRSVLIQSANFLDISYTTLCSAHHLTDMLLKGTIVSWCWLVLNWNFHRIVCGSISFEFHEGRTSFAVRRWWHIAASDK